MHGCMQLALWLWIPILHVIFPAHRFPSSLQRIFIQLTLASIFASAGGGWYRVVHTKRGFHLLLSTDQPPPVPKGTAFRCPAGPVFNTSKLAVDFCAPRRETDLCNGVTLDTAAATVAELGIDITLVGSVTTIG